MNSELKYFNTNYGKTYAVVPKDIEKFEKTLKKNNGHVFRVYPEYAVVIEAFSNYPSELNLTFEEFNNLIYQVKNYSEVQYNGMFDEYDKVGDKIEKLISEGINLEDYAGEDSWYAYCADEKKNYIYAVSPEEFERVKDKTELVCTCNSIQRGYLMIQISIYINSKYGEKFNKQLVLDLYEKITADKEYITAISKRVDERMADFLRKSERAKGLRIFVD